MIIRIFTATLCLSLLGACATGRDFWTGMTQEEIQANPALYAQRRAQASQSLDADLANNNAMLMQQNAIRARQLQSYQAPGITTFVDPKTAIIYCRNLSGNIVTCKQVN